MVRGKTIWIYGYDSITPKFANAVIELAKVSESVNFVVNRSDFGLDEMLTEAEYEDAMRSFSYREERLS